MTPAEPTARNAGATAPPPGCPAHRGVGDHADSAVPLSGPRFQTEPSRLYREMRRDHGSVAPVLLEGGIPAWLVLGYRELHQVTGDPVLFSRDSEVWNQWDRVPEDWPLAPLIGRGQPSILYTTGERHRERAAMVSDALEAVDPFMLRRFAEQLADELIDGFCAEGGTDIIPRYAMPFPVRVLARIYGYPDDQGPGLAAAAIDLADGGELAQAAQRYLFEATASLLDGKKDGAGPPDVASRLLRNTAGFTEEEALHDLIVLVIAGHTLTADWIGNSLRLMLTDERFATSLSGGRHSVADAMNEVLWEDTPAQNAVGRWATRDTTLGNRPVKAGDMLLLGIAAANNDPQVRTHGSALTGGNNAYFSFGHGEYRCPFPAQEIAEVIARTAIEVLLDRLPDLDLAVPAESLTRRPSPWARGLTTLPVTFTPAPTVRPGNGRER
ncbi:cytochrome P450 [Streptomyces sp. NPDC050509]|uniref:cytochrome P450 n=1 Tax=Streptomyces sp. NPDC050509 TaxID=3365620 RepID=UPI0037A3A0AC